MFCKHGKYIKTGVSFITKGRIVDKILNCESHICMCRKCGALFVPVELREIPDLNSITELEK